MDVDKKDPNDLSQYKLDEYDDDVGRQKGMRFIFAALLILKPSRQSILEYQGVDILQGQ